MIKVTWTHLGVDYQLNDTELTKDNGLSSMVLLCLFTDARAKENDVLPYQCSDKRGWPGDTFAPFNWGSRLWLLEREKITNSTMNRAKDYAKEALQPLIDFKLIKKTNVTAKRVSRNAVALMIDVIKPDNSVENYSALLTWQAHQQEVL